MYHMESEDEFDRRWAVLISTYEQCAEYLNQYVHPNRHMWCQLWTRRYTTFGAKSTQRSETTNNVVKYFLEFNSTLEAIFATILEITQKWVKSDCFVYCTISSPIMLPLVHISSNHNYS